MIILALTIGICCCCCCKDKNAKSKNQYHTFCKHHCYTLPYSIIKVCILPVGIAKGTSKVNTHYRSVSKSEFLPTILKLTIPYHDKKNIKFCHSSTNFEPKSMFHHRKIGFWF